MYKKIYKAIKKYDSIVIARHIGVDPDALGSQLALKEAIELTFPEKEVYAIGNGSTKFYYIGRLSKVEEIPKDALLIVLDTPDKKRIDGTQPEHYKEVIKMDHHPFIEEYANIELIDDTASSTCQLILELLSATKLQMNKSIAEKLFIGLACDTNRFAFRNSTPRTFYLVSRLLEEYPLDIEKLYENIYMRPLLEFRFQGYIEQNLVVTENGFAYIKISPEALEKFKVDSGAAGNMINSFNYVDEILAWAMVTEDVKNDLIKVNIRSRGPEINQVAEKYHGGGHKYASGVRGLTMEEVDCLLEELDHTTGRYIETLESQVE